MATAIQEHHNLSGLIVSDFRETLYTVDSAGNRKWVYPTIIFGSHYKQRVVVGTCLLFIYLVTPWITIGNHQAVQLDIPGRRLIAFGQIFWATDTIFLMLILFGLGLSLFFFTALLGRVWCGWACPETVFLEYLFRPIENLIEGSAATRRKLDQSPWSLRKVRIKLTKYGVFSILSWIIASTTLAYFVGREALFEMMCHSPLQNLPTFLATLFIMVVVLFQFGWFREQFCTVICPYARFQSVLMDQDSLLVGYDAIRGEPRGKASNPNNDKKGDCVDCGLCIRVCPTGIDIRNGTQLECVHCASCIDACNSIMTKVGRPLGLIRYATEHELMGESHPTLAKRLFRPRILLYSSLFFLLALAWVFFLSTRELSEVQLLRRGGGSTFTITDDGKISNLIQLHFSNKSEETLSYLVQTEEKDLTLTVAVSPFTLGPGEMGVLPIFAAFPRESLHGGKRTAKIVVTDGKGFSRPIEVSFLGPE